MRSRLAGALLAVLLCAAPARASEWGGIVPATSTTETVRAQYGGPTKSQTQKIDNYDTSTWVYEGAQAPTGMTRMVVEFGLLQAGSYRKDVVRSFTLEPKHGIFHRRIVLLAWGTPARVGKHGDAEVFYYPGGLVVTFDKDGFDAQTLVFTPPQPDEPGTTSR